MDQAKQIAALPVRRNLDGTTAVLLITSRETQRWVIPKGWPMKGKTEPQSAAAEAWEEAGIKGNVSSAPLGTYTYEKRRRRDVIKVQVSVYVMDVTAEHARWPERKQRRRAWFSAAEAAAAVEEAGLRRLIQRLSLVPASS